MTDPTAEPAATNGRGPTGSPSAGAAVTHEAALDALAAGLEHVDQIDLAGMQRWATETDRATVEHLTEGQRREACQTARREAEKVLRASYPDAPPEQVQEALHAALVRPGATVGRVVDLGALLREGIPPVEYLPGSVARRMVYAVGVTGFTGHPESGKSSTVGRVAVEAMQAGRDVIYLDYEQGSAETARRFAALGANADLLSKRLVYREFPGAPDWDALGALWDAHPDAVGVWDSTRGILRTLGLDEDRAAEVGRFMDPLVEFTLSRGIATLLIDHVAKAATDSTGYARGSGDKLAAVQAQWFVKKARAFDETEAGEIELVRWKARSGALNRLHRFAVGDGQGALTFARLNPDKSPEGKAEAAIIDYLKAGHPMTYSLREIGGHVSGRAADTRGRVKALAEDAQRPVASVTEAGHTRYAYVPNADQEPEEADALSF